MKSSVSTHHNLPAVRAYSLVSRVFNLRRVNVLLVSEDVEASVGSVIALITLKVFDPDVNSLDVKWNFPLFRENLPANGTSVAKILMTSLM